MKTIEKRKDIKIRVLLRIILTMIIIVLATYFAFKNNNMITRIAIIVSDGILLYWIVLGQLKSLRDKSEEDRNGLTK